MALVFITGDNLEDFEQFSSYLLCTKPYHGMVSTVLSSCKNSIQ
jgi:hypothetical protein